MSALIISGGRRLSGVVEVPGSKNTALALLSAVVLAEGETLLDNIPDLSDTRAKARLLERFGARSHWTEGSLYVDCSSIAAGDAEPEVVRSIRTSFYLLGPLLARIGHVEMPAPGGCMIGARPVDFHLKGLSAFGAEIELVGGVFRARAKRLRGAEIYLDFPSQGATQHLMTTATVIEGITVIHNAALEPEVQDLAAFLNKMGARIEGAGTNTITIHGVTSLKPAVYRVPADRLQAGTYMLAGAITQGDVTVTGILPEHQTAVLSKLREAGATVEEGFDWARVSANTRLRATDIRTMPYPGFPTDMQQPFTSLLSLAEGPSVIEETIYESRIGHVPELNRMGTSIKVSGSTMFVTGVEGLHGAEVKASDLRAGAALILAGLAAKGETQVGNVHFIDRGYERLEEKLRGLGADIRRLASEARQSESER